jgi:hypothetical protein
MAEMISLHGHFSPRVFSSMLFGFFKIPIAKSQVAERQIGGILIKNKGQIGQYRRRIGQ